MIGPNSRNDNYLRFQDGATWRDTKMYTRELIRRRFPGAVLRTWTRQSLSPQALGVEHAAMTAGNSHALFVQAARPALYPRLVPGSPPPRSQTLFGNALGRQTNGVSRSFTCPNRVWARGKWDVTRERGTRNGM